MTEPLPGSGLPPWLRAGIVTFLTLVLTGNILADVFVAGYDGQFVSMMLGGIVGTSVGVEKLLRRNGKD